MKVTTNTNDNAINYFSETRVYLRYRYIRLSDSRVIDFDTFDNHIIKVVSNERSANKMLIVKVVTGDGITRRYYHVSSVTWDMNNSEYPCVSIESNRFDDERSYLIGSIRNLEIIECERNDDYNFDGSMTVMA